MSDGHQVLAEQATPELQVRLFGGLEVRRGEQPIAGFESRKVQALLAYLLLEGRRRELPREQLAALLWPEAGDAAARRNLRQALYNLRTVLDPGPGGEPLLLVERRSVACNTEVDCQLDVERFERALAAGLEGEVCRDPAAVARALELYDGDFLAGLPIADSLELEEWVLTEQERLREMALGAARILALHHLGRGETAPGIHHARRWLSFDPVSEEPHRALMRLYALSGRRARALAQYELCLHQLAIELGVKPLAETTELYEAILAEEHAAGELRPIPVTHPVVPMVGRRVAYEELRRRLQSPAETGPNLVSIEGPSGIGKTRLAKTAIHDATAELPAEVVAVGGSWPPIPAPFAVATALLAGLATLRGEPETGSPADLPAGPRRLAEQLGERIAATLDSSDRGPRGDRQPRLILFLDDLHLVDPSSLELVAELLPRLAGAPVWVAVGWDPAAAAPRRLADVVPDQSRSIALAELSAADLDQAARSIVGGGESAVLGSLLARTSQGLPLLAVEWVNLLCDEGRLEETGGGSWAWRPPQPTADETTRSGGVVGRRLACLPNSTRRLVAQAAVIGTQFDVELLTETANEHPAVVETGLELLLERTLLRQVPEGWFETRRERDVSLWRAGVRHGRFQFSHERVRQGVYSALPPTRRQSMHAAVLAALAGREDSTPPEVLAHHALGARQLALAARQLNHAAQRSRALGAKTTAAALAEQAQRTLAELV